MRAIGGRYEEWCGVGTLWADMHGIVCFLFGRRLLSPAWREGQEFKGFKHS